MADRLPAGAAAAAPAARGPRRQSSSVVRDSTHVPASWLRRRPGDAVVPSRNQHLRAAGSVREILPRTGALRVFQSQLHVPVAQRPAVLFVADGRGGLPEETPLQVPSITQNFRGRSLSRLQEVRRGGLQMPSIRVPKQSGVPRRRDPA